MNLRTFELANDLSVNEANALRHAISDAIGSMAHCNSTDENLEVMAMLHTVAIRAGVKAQKTDAAAAKHRAKMQTARKAA